MQFSVDGQPPVSDLIKERLPRTLMLLIIAQTMAVLIAVPWALFAASRADKAVDKVSTVTSFLFIAIPNFGLAVILKYLFSLKWSFFPLIFNAADPFWTRVWQLVLPAMALALPVGSVYQRLLRTDLITHLAGGLHPHCTFERRLQAQRAVQARIASVALFVRHDLRNQHGRAARWFPDRRTDFHHPGLGGSAIVEAILREDFPVVLAIVMIVTAAFVVINILVDLLYSLIDPRVRSA